MADYWLPIRAGSDLVFLGALIHYTLENERYFRDYVVHYTNAPTILRSDFKDTEDLGGLFSGWDEIGATSDDADGSGSETCDGLATIQIAATSATTDNRPTSPRDFFESIPIIITQRFIYFYNKNKTNIQYYNMITTDLYVYISESM